MLSSNILLVIHYKYNSESTLSLVLLDSKGLAFFLLTPFFHLIARCFYYLIVHIWNKEQMDLDEIVLFRRDVIILISPYN